MGLSKLGSPKKEKTMYGFRNDIYTDINVPQTARNELANKPRYDIDGRRYGNTLSDDMFAMKNPNYQGHTPESYEYFGETQPSEDNTWAPASGWNEAMGLPVLENKKNAIEQYIAANPYLKYGAEDFRSMAPRRKKVVGEGDSLPYEVYKDWGLMDDILEFPEKYTQEELNWAEKVRADREARNRVESLGTDDLRAEKLGQYQDPNEWVSRRDADVDSYLNELVNYSALSPATLEQLAKMGVNRPVSPEVEDDASEYLNFLVNAYRRNMGLK